ncbi:MAG: hypothetical protein M3270_04455 [Thermoproteota archaeon]|nr:hypothetical protein [Thermoproteota archaeon]
MQLQDVVDIKAAAQELDAETIEAELSLKRLGQKGKNFGFSGSYDSRIDMQFIVKKHLQTRISFDLL